MLRQLANSIVFTTVQSFRSSPCAGVTVYTSGEICLDILGSAWSSVYDVGAVLISLRVKCKDYS